MFASLLSSFLLIFISEMGDKTQLTAMAFTSRFKPGLVIAAISAASVLTNFAAVAAGGFFSEILPFNIIKIVSYILFILFGVWTLAAKEDKESGGAGRKAKVIINPFFTVACLFFISELGDKTQIAAMTLAMNENPYGVFAGASLGMICANLVAIGVGILLGKKLPQKAVKYFSAALFIIIGAAGFISLLFK
ncbi:MAG: TMEM165/GDT1 family protein [Endomicrobium sp.]|jgi:putative Ca2+/H+ antiporter (TMEM165/GDT1 family)|nr:TMEM165/GDT1 family protein [Endomicrobium sp.]